MNFVRITSVAARIALAFAIILPVTLVTTGIITFQTVDSYFQARSIEQENAAANNLIAGVYELLMERLATNNALQAQPAVSAEAREEIVKRRSLAVEKIESARSALGQQNFSGKAALFSELKAAVEKADAYRLKADAALMRIKPDRDGDTVQNYYVAMSDLSSAAQKVWATVLSHTGQVDAELGRLAHLRILSWNLRDIAGFERSHIGQSISAKIPIPANKIAEIKEYRAEIGLMWRLLKISVIEQDHPAILKGLQSAKDSYFAIMQPLADRMRMLGNEGSPYLMSTEKWVETTTPLLFTLLDVMYGAGQASEAHTSKIETTALIKLLLCVGLFFFALGGAALAVGMIIRTVATPLADLSRVLNSLTAETCEVHIPHTDRHDEIGRMARALKSFRENYMAMQALRTEQAQSQDQEIQRTKKFTTLALHFQQTVGGIVTAVSSAAREFAAASRQMSAAAEEGMNISTSVAVASEEASVNVQAVAKSVDELATSFGPISGKVSESSHIAESAKKIAIETNQNVSTLVNATNAISDVTKMISEIAAQTNLLALNATIEAARAGDAGRGFAIVASEVKNLAVQTARATEQIGRQIENVQTATGNTVEAIKTITGTIDQINGIAITIADAVETQSIATREISSNVGQAAIGTLEVTTNIVGVKDAAAQTGDTAKKLLAAAASLNEQSQHLANEVDAFLQAARAA